MDVLVLLGSFTLRCALGVPVAYIPQGKPVAILHSLGLDADGIVAEVKRLLDA